MAYRLDFLSVDLIFIYVLSLLPPHISFGFSVLSAKLLEVEAQKQGKEVNVAMLSSFFF